MLTATKANALLRLLYAVYTKGMCSSSELAHELGIHEGLLRRMLMTLVEGGYLQRVTGECAQRCGSCSLQQICLAPDSAIWIVTEKGRRALQAYIR
ncbi:MAG: helix-turn-helix domain-containing protein [Anaerolineae bacterium]|nr:helix-turn-helix domain-containing protein [Anaerolineae bacterium]MDW8097891.1 helix-turn-helix domain-containing protein [Anaerolineae bacterium]